MIGNILDIFNLLEVHRIDQKWNTESLNYFYSITQMETHTH